MKPIVALDLSLFAIPYSANASVEVETLLNRINAWASTIEKQNCATFVTQSDAVDILRSANCYPATHNVRALLELFELEHVFSPYDINTRIFSLLQRAERIVDVLGFEVLEVQVEPIAEIEAVGVPHKDVARSFEELLATIAISGRSELVRVSTGLPAQSREINFAGDVHSVDELGEIILFDEPKRVEAKVVLVDAPSDFIGSLDPQAVWLGAEDAIQLHMAISLEVDKLLSLNEKTLPLSGVSTFCIGAAFLNSIQQNLGFADHTTANVIRQKCALVVGNIAAAGPRPFSVRRSDDGAPSFRVHIGKSHEALRLMYWSRPDGSIEFANVGRKSELAITEGNAAAHAASRFD